MPHTPPLILISNHEESYLALMEELLTEEGYQAHIARSPNDAYLFMLNAMPDMLILDVPIANPDPAWTTLNMLHLNPQTQHIPTLICSTNVLFMREMTDHLKTMGCETLAKPFRLEDMLVKIRKLLGESPTE